MVANLILGPFRVEFHVFAFRLGKACVEHAEFQETVLVGDVSTYPTTFLVIVWQR